MLLASSGGRDSSLTLDGGNSGFEDSFISPRCEHAVTPIIRQKHKAIIIYFFILLSPNGLARKVSNPNGKYGFNKQS